MNPFVERHQEKIAAVLSCFDRIVITGTPAVKTLHIQAPCSDNTHASILDEAIDLRRAEAKRYLPNTAMSSASTPANRCKLVVVLYDGQYRAQVVQELSGES